MKDFTLLLTVAFCLSACFGKSSDKPNVIDAKNLPTIDMVATHAIDLDISVAQLSFVPNSVAPWLGRIILRDDDGFLYSTDIEGRDPKPVGTGKYIDIFGLVRDAAPGVFLAITIDNKIEAFIESDDDGNFSPIIYSGRAVKFRRFCLRRRANKNQIGLLTSDGNYETLGLTISNSHIQQELLRLEPDLDTKTPDICNLHFPSINLPEKSFTIQKNAPAGLYLSYARPLTSNQKLPVFEKYHVSITNGLSVRGAKHIKYIATTQSNYGGGAYADGVLALLDDDEDRIVFMSLRYAEQQLLKAVNPPVKTTDKMPQ